MNYTANGLDAAAGQGISRAQIEVVLNAAIQLRLYPDSQTLTVTAGVDGGLVTVWLAEARNDDEWDLVTAFESGLTIQLKWTHMLGERNA